MIRLALVGFWPKASVNGTHGGVEQRPIACAVGELHPLVVISILCSLSFTHTKVVFVVTPSGFKPHQGSFAGCDYPLELTQPQVVFNLT